MRHVSHALFVLLLGCLLAADTPPEEVVQKDLKKLEGIWVIESMEADGNPVTNEALLKIEFLFEKNSCTLQVGEKVLLKGEIKIDPAATPAVIDFFIKPGPERSARLEGIYQFEGDTLRWCSAAPAKDRPIAFATKPADESTCVVLKRKKL